MPVVDPGEIVQKLPYLARFQDRAIAAAAGRDGRGAKSCGGTQLAESGDREGRQTFNVWRVQRALNSVLIEQPRAQHVLAFQRVHEPQARLPCSTIRCASR